MTKSIKGHLLCLVTALSVSGGVVAQNLNVLNWSDYIAKDTISNFEQKADVKVAYDVFDSNEVLEARLLSGTTGYDIVAPTSEFLSRQIKAGVFAKLDKSKLPNWKNLDPKMLAMLDSHDNDNKYSVPYMWGTSGIGYNKKRVEEILGQDAPVDSWALVFEPEYMKKLAPHGVAFLDTPTEIYPIALSYLGLDPNSTNPADYKKAEKLVTAVRPYIRYFNASSYISDLANGEVVVAIGWSGDVMQAAARAEEAGNGIDIEYSIPKEGTGVWFDMLAIPADAQNIDEAHEFINYLLEPKVIADISNYVAYANPNPSSKPFMDEEIVGNTGIYPDEATYRRLYSFKEVDSKLNRIMIRSWNRIMAGR